MKPTRQEESPKLLARMMGSTRYAILLAVFGIFVGSVSLLISSTFEMIIAVWETLAGSRDVGDVELRIVLIEVVDTVLVATVLYMIAIGLYQLFVDSSISLPSWLQTRSLNDLELRLAGMSVTVVAVIFVTVALESHGNTNILGFGLATAAIIVALSLFIYIEGKHGSHEDH
ncbi:MAG TPA: YqhA family protein [Anaerolineae bacterium]|nr:YqhA family protein [Anaerolineae bacterium]